ncbi:MAG TPA: LytTR family DNA-binding domain-containing protein [Saprospiraceae bacterium]|nr:LytTR family DNA-binding domain-containing protein [Saprospiraceae bacterium]
MMRCLAIDDEAIARRMLEDNIRQIPFLEWAGSCKNAFEAMEVLQRETIDLIFLDIQMPGMLGTQFLKTLAHKPMVIFVTAYPNYAVESYDLDVVDYLMKPVSIERFAKAAHKAWALHQQKQAAAPAADTPESFFVHVEYALVRITVRDITHIEGMKDYVKIYLSTAPKPVLTKSTLKALEEKLPPKDFMRVHKSYIVQLGKVEAIRNRELRIGEYDIPIGEAQIEALMQALVKGA